LFGSPSSARIEVVPTIALATASTPSTSGKQNFVGTQNKDYELHEKIFFISTCSIKNSKYANAKQINPIFF
jgi:hypothetical protein